jgi:hypothetical protein
MTGSLCATMFSRADREPMASPAVTFRSPEISAVRMSGDGMAYVSRLCRTQFSITLTHARGGNFDVQSVRSEPPTCIESVAAPIRSSDNIARLTIVPRADPSSRVFRIIVEVSCDGVLSEIPVTVYAAPKRGAD